MRSSSLALAVAATVAWAGNDAAFAQQLSGPTFDCRTAVSDLARAICRDPGTWQADWALSAAYWASYFSVDGTDRTRLRDGHVVWIKTVERECGTAAMPDVSRNSRVGTCVVLRYRARAAAYRSALSGDAAAEAGLGPETLIALQSRLIGMGFMTGQADGVFGTATRQAIRSYLQTLGSPPADFLDARARAAVLSDRPVAVARRPVPPRPTGAADDLPDPLAFGDPRTVLQGLASGLLGASAPRLIAAARPSLRPAQPDAPLSKADEWQFDAPPHLPAAQHATPASPVADKPEPPTNAEFSDAGTAVLASPLGAPTQNAETGIRTVEVKGTGDSADAARKDAARLAIQQVVGLFIDNRRRIELNVSDAKVSEIVNEKLISYTNAYVSKMEVVRSEQKDGTFEVTAKVGVTVKPLLKVLQDNAVPTVAFDAITAASTVETLSQEKAAAIELYADLVDKAASLVTVGVGTPKVDPDLPSSPDEAWVRIPLTYGVNDDAMKEWRSKFDLFAQDRAALTVQILPERLRAGGSCTVPTFAFGYDKTSGWDGSFMSKRPVSPLHGVAACFAAYQTAQGIMAECLGRSFVTTERPGSKCTPGQPCLFFDQTAAKVRLVVEFIDQAGAVIYAVRQNFPNFPAPPIAESRATPDPRQTVFSNFCVAQQAPFYAASTPYGGGLRAAYGDVLMFPASGSRVRSYLNVRLPNALVPRIGSVRARFDKDAS